MVSLCAHRMCHPGVNQVPSRAITQSTFRLSSRATFVPGGAGNRIPGTRSTLAGYSGSTSALVNKKVSKREARQEMAGLLLGVRWGKEPGRLTRDLAEEFLEERCRAARGSNTLCRFEVRPIVTDLDNADHAHAVVR